MNSQGAEDRGVTIDTVDKENHGWILEGGDWEDPKFQTFFIFLTLLLFFFFFFLVQGKFPLYFFERPHHLIV